MRKMKILLLILIIFLININVNATAIEKISIDNVPIPNIGEKYSDYIIRAKKDNWSYSNNLQIDGIKLSLSETDNTRGIISCTQISDSTIQYFRGVKGQGYTSTALVDNDVFIEGNDYSCAIGIIPNSEYSISESLVGNNDTNDILTNKNSNVLINKIQSKLYKYILVTNPVYNITFDFKPGHTVSFVTNTNNKLSDVSILPNEKIEEPTNIKKSDNKLIGWYTENYEKKWNFDTDKVTNNMILYAKWEPCTYTFISGNNQEFNKGKIKSYSFKIDGDNDSFESLKVGNLLLTKNKDFKLIDDSTKIIFTSTGIDKLNKLSSGTYKIETKFTSNTVTGKLVINEENPKTLDSIEISIIAGSVSLIILFCCGIYQIKKEDIINK